MGRSRGGKESSSSKCATALLVLPAAAARAGLVRLGLLRFWLAQRLGRVVAHDRLYTPNVLERVVNSLFRRQGVEPQGLLVVLGDAVAILVIPRKVVSGNSVSKGRALSVELEGPLVVLREVLAGVVESPELVDGGCVILMSSIPVPIRRSLVALFASSTIVVVLTCVALAIRMALSRFYLGL